jgi:topoisomerase (DNA) II binding protein 1
MVERREAILNLNFIRFLGSIASGKWILHYSYMEASMEAGELLTNFDSYEWGNPANGFIDDLETPQEKQLAAASHRWRLSINDKNGAFSGITAIIHTAENRKGAFARLLNLGKGKVLENAKPPYSDAKGATHCLAEPKKLPKISMDFEAMAAQRVAVVGPLYINEFLVADPAPPVDDFILEEYKPFWNKYRTKK